MQVYLDKKDLQIPEVLNRGTYHTMSKEKGQNGSYLQNTENTENKRTSNTQLTKIVVKQSGTL